MTHRPIHSSSILLASVSRLSLAALLLVGGCDTQQQIERGQAEDTISFRSLTAPQYATRIYDMARSAK
ncbi:MAG: hypothetical protein K0V04_24000, partial [Deltaproteobacteria bacterium]|nr:hypothetical protein [Deltaproteobacteria bacterium]